MNWLVYHFVSGQSFFSGGLLMIAAVLLAKGKRPIARRVAVLSFLFGAMAVVLSSTPLPYWSYGVLVLVTVVWIISRFRRTANRMISVSLVAVFVAAMAWEAAFHFLPAPAQQIADTPSLTIIGDSVTAGMGEKEAETWPKILARTHHVEVQDLSHIGETSASTLKRIQDQTLTSSLVLIEIGGNDLLGSTSSAQFEIDLDALLKYLVKENRRLLMFELPLPPFFHEYGRIQRTLAARYDVALIPKRYFLDVLADDASTLDTIHLSQAGHQQMAETVWRIIEPMYQP